MPICPNCEGKGYTIRMYHYQFGNQNQTEKCAVCDGIRQVTDKELAKYLADREPPMEQLCNLDGEKT